MHRIATLTHQNVPSLLNTVAWPLVFRKRPPAKDTLVISTDVKAVEDLPTLAKTQLTKVTFSSLLSWNCSGGTVESGREATAQRS